ncbi:hypothetical protein JTE90_002576 [Oedothorax gibbosus]|uniref:HAT C-terminal dimerisation domain-containing protein n=1 Tax=Oedothorax gibbosus TaxID=931172 RepID=A0AAV6TT89_9ARAC|nr:hypothetical protein JTE90_002576 [Oedothorax gibbosus]
MRLQALPTAVLNCITDSVNKRLKSYEKRSYCILASLLNPYVKSVKYKKRSFKTEYDVEGAIKYLQNEYAHYLSLDSRNSQISSRQETETAKESTIRDLLSFLDDPVATANPTSDDIIDVRQYVEIPKLDIQKIHYYLTIGRSQLAKLKYLAIPATSCPAECIFSAASFEGTTKSLGKQAP